MSEMALPESPKTKEELRTEVLDFAEKAGEENIKFHTECAESISKEANTTLTILLAGGGASLGYTMKLIELGNHLYLLFGTAAVTIFVFVIAYLLVMGVMMVEDIAAPSNEPANLYQPAFALEDIREAELENLGVRIKKNIQRNGKKAARLNRLRLALVFAPVIFAIGLTFGIIFG